MYETLEHIFHAAVNYGILVVEAVGAVIIVVSAVRALINLLNKRGNARLLLAEGITTALSFLLCGEVLKTIVAPEWKDLGMTCAVLLMRAGMAVLLHWENSHETKEHAD